MKGPAVTVGVLILAVLILLVVPTTYSTVTGRPIYLDCGGLSPDVCDDAIDFWDAEEGGSGPITLFIIDPPFHTACGDVDMARWVLWVQRSFDPLC
jgi:hypothetical protein